MKLLARSLQALRSSRLGARSHPPLQVIGWWELRRAVYNLALGAAGGACLLVLFCIAILSERLVGEPIGLPDPPGLLLLGVAIYALGANFFYTGGWVVELVARRAWPQEAHSLATAVFSLGLLGSLLLTLGLGGVLVLASALSLLFTLAQHRA